MRAAPEFRGGVECDRHRTGGFPGVFRVLAAFLGAGLLAAMPAFAQVPDLTITKSHGGNFAQGQVVGAGYTITVTNAGGGPVLTGNTVTVVDALPAGLTATAMVGPPVWNCVVASVSCTTTSQLAAGQSYPPITLTVSVAGNAGSPLINSVSVSGGGETNTANNTATDPTTILGPADLTITKTHGGNFTQGQVSGAGYTITVSNAAGGGPVFTGNTVTVVDTLPAGLTATVMTGPPSWNCVLATVTCTTNDFLSAGQSYPVITLLVSVAGNAGSLLINSVTVSGGGETNTANDTATDPTTVLGPADLTVTKTHSGNFTQGQTGAQYIITVSNGASSIPVVGGNTVTVIDTLPAGLTATAMSGSGWNCVLAALSCTTNSSLGTGQSYQPISLTVTVASNAGNPLVNVVTVSGGGEVDTSNDTAMDSTTVVPTVPVPQSAVSRKVHGGASAFNLPLSP